MAARVVTSAALGALAVVVGWATWSMLEPRQEAAALPTAREDVAQVASPATPVPARAPVEQAAQSVAAAASRVPSAPARTPVALRDGLVMEHGMPTAVHALADDGSQAAASPAVTLPAGVRTQDAVVNRAGMVTLTHSGVEPSTATPPDNAPRPPVSTHAP